MPYKDFTVGQTLTSQEVDDFLMRQSVMVFQDSTERGTAIGTAVIQGMVTYLRSTNTVEQYSGSAWGPVGTDSFTTIGTAGNLLVSAGTAGVVWLANGEAGQAIISAGTAGVRYENSISPLLLLGV